MSLILIDQDGVLADFECHVKSIWYERFGVALPERVRSHFYLHDDYPEYKDALQTIYAERGFFANLPPVAGAIVALHELLDAGLDVRICTAPVDAYQHCVSEKFAWVEQHLGGDWIRRIILTKDKTWVRGDILIDDKPYITGSLVPIWTHWLYDHPYNRGVNKPRVCWTDRQSWQGLLMA